MRVQVIFIITMIQFYFIFFYAIIFIIRTIRVYFMLIIKFHNILFIQYLSLNQQKHSIMPRLKPVSSLINASVSKQALRSSLKASPSHISMFCSEEEGQNLLDVLPDIKPIKDLQLSAKLKSKLIKAQLDMQFSARQAHKVALSANQLRCQQKCFVINNRLLLESQQQSIRNQGNFVLTRMRDHYKKQQKMVQKLNKAIQTFSLIATTPQKGQNWNWILDDSKQSQLILSDSYSLMINPTIIFGTQLQTRYEQCISFPFFDCMIPRYNRLLIHYYNENYQSKLIYTSGFSSRVIQHHCQHLEGKSILDWRINHGNIAINDSVQQYFPKTTNIVQDYSKSLKNIFQQFPELIDDRKEYFIEANKLDKLFNSVLVQESTQEDTQKLIGRRNVGKSIGHNLTKDQNYNTNFTVNKVFTTELLPFEDDYVTRIVKHFKKEFVKFDQKVELGLISTQQLTKQKETLKIANQSNPQYSILQYNQKTYSQQIKITYLNQQQDSKNSQLVSNEKSKSKSKLKQTQENNFYQQHQISEEEVKKLMAKSKKGKKKK